MGLMPSDYKLDVSDDRMTASLTLLNPELAESLKIADLRAVLSQAGIARGIIDEHLNAFLVSPLFGEPIVVARGKAPPVKILSEVSYSFDTCGAEPTKDGEPCKVDLTAADNDNGRIDLKNVRSFQNVSAGDVLVRPTVITPEMCGEDVFGNQIKPEFRKASSPKPGKGVELDEATGMITATVTGNAELKGGKVNVMDSLDISGDVDYSVGNIDFVGNLKVQGDVHPGFHVRAGRDLTITGNVDRAHISCVGDLCINGIVFGAGETTVNVDGNATIGVLDQCEVNVRGNLSITNYMRHCNARIGGSLEILGKKGNLVGGEVHVFRNVNVTSLGSRMAALTKLTVGRNPFAETNPDELRGELMAEEKKLKQIMLGIEALNRRLASSGPDQAVQERLDKLLQAEQQYAPRLDSLRAELEDAQRKIAYFHAAMISVRETVHPGVVVNFRDRLQYKTMDSLSHMCFYERDAEIRTKSL